MAHTHRLLQLIRVLENIPDSRFNLGVWKMENQRSAPSIFDHNACGTVACAAGWAAQDSWFRENGFSLKENALYTYPVYVAPGGVTYEGWHAVARFFAISENMANQLFAPAGYPGKLMHEITPQMVIEKIKLRYPAVRRVLADRDLHSNKTTAGAPAE